MEITFTTLVSDSSSKYVSEEELVNNIEKYTEFLAPTSRVHYGKLIIVEEGQPEIIFFDELCNICMQFCFIVLKEYLENKKATFFIMMTGLPIEFIDEGEKIKIKTQEVEGIYDKKEFVKKTYECGLRYLDFLEVLPSEGHKHHKIIIDEYREPVTKFLKAQNLI